MTDSYYNTDWRIKDFTPYLIKKEHFLDHAAYLYHEVDPAFDWMENPAYPYRTYLAEAIGHDDAVKFYPNTSYNYKYLGRLPDEVWGKIKKTCKVLLSASKEGTLTTRDNKAGADDLRKFFTELFGEKPKFLFPEERNEAFILMPLNESDLKLKDADYQLWDLRDELTLAESACLCLDLNPNKCVSYLDKNAPSWALKIVFHKGLSVEVESRIATIYDVLDEATKKGTITETTPSGPTAWMAQPFIPKLSKASLKAYAEKNGIRPKSLFVGERGKQPAPQIVIKEKNKKTKRKKPEKAQFEKNAVLAKLPKSTTLKEAAYLLKKSKRTILRWIQEKKIPAKKVGHSWEIPGLLEK